MSFMAGKAVPCVAAAASDFIRVHVASSALQMPIKGKVDGLFQQLGPCLVIECTTHNTVLDQALRAGSKFTGSSSNP